MRKYPQQPAPRFCRSALCARPRHHALAAVLLSIACATTTYAQTPASDEAAPPPTEALTPEARAAAENMLTGTLKTLFAVAEQYPQLRAIESFTKLQDSLSEIEDHIQNARRFYNAVVRDLNTKIAMFPSNIIANMFNFEPREFFELDTEAERQAPKVAFGKSA